MEIKMTSKSSSLKALLLKAWRERWTDLKWGINIKKILPRGISGDAYNLADFILEQALIGPGPNHLFFSYLKHTLSSQLVSYSAVLQYISKYDAFYKVECINALLDFVESICTSITCRSKPEEDLLAKVILSLVNWLLQCYLHLTSKQPQLISTSCHLSDLPEKLVRILKHILNCDFMSAMILLAKHADKELYAVVINKCQEIDKHIKHNQVKSYNSIQYCIQKLYQINIEDSLLPAKIAEVEPITQCLQPLLTMYVLTNPCTETSVFVSRLLIIQKLKNYSNSRFYCEIIRAGLTCLRYAVGTSNESLWAAFAFLKMPLIIKELHYNVTCNGNKKRETSADICAAFELLLQCNSLLDVVDSLCCCNCFEFLVIELQKQYLLSEKLANHLCSKRNSATHSTLRKLDLTKQLDTSSLAFILQIESTLTCVLKLLDADHNKTHEAMLSTLYQILSGRRFELILAVAAIQGKIKILVNHLIKFNESSKALLGNNVNSNGNGSNGGVRSPLFDISFIMLCYIVQHYGSNAVLDEGGNSFFEQWVRECIPEYEKPKSPEKMLQGVDPAKIDYLLQHVYSGQADLMNIKWDVMCKSSMGIVKELLLCWESGVLNTIDIDKTLDGLRSTACCLSICATSWLCAYKNVAHQDAIFKLMHMIEHFRTPLINTEMPDHYKEQLNLMNKIMEKMQIDIHPPVEFKPKVFSSCVSIVSQQPLRGRLQLTWQNIHKRGWLDLQTFVSFKSLLNAGGSLWFVSNIVKEMFKFKLQEDLDRATDLAFSIFHLDIEKCTLDLLNNVLPQYLYNSSQNQELVEPQSLAFAKLCVYCISSTLECKKANTKKQNSRKRHHQDQDANKFDKFGVPANKILRLNDTEDCTPVFCNISVSSANATTNGKKNTVSCEPIIIAINKLFNDFAVLASKNFEVSRTLVFVLQFLQNIVQCDVNMSTYILQELLQSLIPCLLKTLPNFFTSNLILKLYNIETEYGRKASSRDLCMLRNLELKTCI